MVFVKQSEDPDKWEGQQESRILVGFAVSLLPEDVFEESGKPAHLSLPEVATNYLVNRLNRTGLGRTSLSQSITDVSNYVTNAFDAHNFTGTFDEALGYVTSPRTADGLAVVARQSLVPAHNIITSGAGILYRLSEEGGEPHIAVDHALIKKWFKPLPDDGPGCPAASTETDPHSPEPIFRRFGPWAAELALRAVYRDDFSRYPGVSVSRRVQ